MSIAVAPDMYYIKWDLYSNGQILDFSIVKVQTLFSLYCNWMYLDLIKAFWHYYQNPTKGEVYNIGGSRNSNISILEAIVKIEEISGKRISYTVSDEARSGDHIWYVSDIRKFRSHYPNFEYDYDMDRILREMLNAVAG